MEFKLGKQLLFFGQQPAKAVRVNNHAVEALEERCDPTSLIEQFRHTDRWFPNGKFLSGLVIVTGAEALLAAGLEAPILPVAHAFLSLDGGASLDLIGTCFWQAALSRACTQLEHWDQAVQAQNAAMAIYPRLTRSEQQEVSHSLCLTGYLLQLHAGLTDGLEEKCRALLAAAPTLRKQVEASLLLGKFYAETGRADEAQPHLAYAVQHGNKLLAQKEADLLLARLRGDELTAGQLFFAAGRAFAQGRFQRSAELYAQALAAPAGQEAVAISVERMSYVAALLNLGRFSDALEQLDLMGSAPPVAPREQFQAVCLYHRTLALAGLDRLEEAVEAQNAAMALFTQYGLESLRFSLSSTAALLKLKQGRLEGLEEELSALLSAAKTDYEQLSAHMRMAEYLQAAGRAQEARPHLEYVLSHSGEHRYHQQAQAALDALSS